MNYLYTKKTGFTVLEFLIVVAIMVIMMSIVLSGLNSSRIKTTDEGKISELNTVVLGLTQYFQICNEYPLELDKTATCDPVNNPDLLGKLLPELLDASPYFYVPISYNRNGSICLGAHIGILLSDTDNVYAGRDSNFRSNDPRTTLCISNKQQVSASTTPVPFDGSVAGIYDKKL